MSSRTWWKISSRDFMPSRYTEIRKAMVKGEMAGLPGGSQPAHRETGRLLGQEATDLQSQATGLEQPLGPKASGTGSAIRGGTSGFPKWS